MRIHRIHVFLVVLAGMSLLISACAGTLRPGSQEPQRFTLIVTGGTAGEPAAQGCACRRLGGMERMSGCIAQTRVAAPGPLVLNCGNLLFAHSSEASQQNLQTAEFLLHSIRHMQAAAMNVSERDCAAGAAFLKEHAGQTALLSANLRDIATGELLFSPYLITTLNRVRIGIFGLSGASGSTPAHGIRVDDPLLSAAPIVSMLQRKGCDVIVLLSQLSEEQNLHLLTGVPGIHFVFGSPDAPARAEPVRSGDGYSIAPGQGTHVAVLECLLEGRGPAFTHIGAKQTETTPAHAQSQQTQAEPTRGRFSYQLTALDSTAPSDPAVELMLETLREDRLRQAMQTQLPFRPTVPAVDIEGLTEAGRKRAIRLMNEISCADRRIADCAADTALCRETGRMVAEGVRTGQTDGAIHFTVQRAIQARTGRNDVPLDKSGPLQ